MEHDKVVVKSPDEDEDHEPEDLAEKLADKIPGKDTVRRSDTGDVTWDMGWAAWAAWAELKDFTIFTVPGGQQGCLDGRRGRWRWRCSESTAEGPGGSWKVQKFASHCWMLLDLQQYPLQVILGMLQMGQFSYPMDLRPVSTNQERLGKNLGRRWAGRFHGTARWHGEFDHLGAVPPCVYSHLLHTVGLSAAFIAKKIGLTFQRSFHDMLGLLGPKVDLVDFDIFRLRPWPRKGQKLYMVSFGLSLLWIGSFAFLLVWWTEIALRRNWVKLSETEWNCVLNTLFLAEQRRGILRCYTAQVAAIIGVLASEWDFCSHWLQDMWKKCKDLNKNRTTESFPLNSLESVSKIPTIISGLTFLAAATSIPDAVSSMAVARKGGGCGAATSTEIQYVSGKLTVCYWKWPFVVDLPIKNGDFP